MWGWLHIIFWNCNSSQRWSRSFVCLPSARSRVLSQHHPDEVIGHKQSFADKTGTCDCTAREARTRRSVAYVEGLEKSRQVYVTAVLTKQPPSSSWRQNTRTVKQNKTPIWSSLIMMKPVQIRTASNGRSHQTFLQPYRTSAGEHAPRHVSCLTRSKNHRPPVRSSNHVLFKPCRTVLQCRA